MINVQMPRWRAGVVALTAVLALVGALLQWHLTINNVQEVMTGKSPLHKPMTVEKCYELAQIQPSYDELGRAFDYPSGGGYIFTLDTGDRHYCTVSYFGSQDHPSGVALDLR